ncbi:MAG TPA: serine/threonine-protein kinase, partial [Myxococcota bacterium]|nr:serine/threonine-protein kinase [Myxococcota bacterium]
MTDKAEGQLSGRTATSETEERGIPLGKVVAQRYRIQSLIARGGMAAVFLADDLLLHRQVALKVLVPPNKADIASFEHRFRREAQALAQLSHPNIVTLHDFGETKESGYFLAMEYIPGPRMTDLVKDGPMEPIRAIRLVQQVVLALRYAHKKGVIHRDLKPSNLLVLQGEDGSETMKVVDFGLVKLAEVDQSLTQPGLVLGSPHCMA